MRKIVQTIKFEGDVDPTFKDWIEGVPGGEKLHSCIQCGTCSAACPVSLYMDYTPRRLMHLSREGFRDEALGSLMLWLCTSCYACTVECPRQIKVTEILYTLKRRAISEGVYPSGFPVPVLAKYFYMMVRATGRMSEMWLVSLVFLRTNIFKALAMSGLGLNLLKTGRMPLKPDMISDRAGFRRYLDAASPEKKEAGG